MTSWPYDLSGWPGYGLWGADHEVVKLVWSFGSVLSWVDPTKHLFTKFLLLVQKILFYPENKNSQNLLVSRYLPYIKNLWVLIQNSACLDLGSKKSRQYSAGHKIPCVRGQSRPCEIVVFYSNQQASWDMSCERTHTHQTQSGSCDITFWVHRSLDISCDLWQNGLDYQLISQIIWLQEWRIKPLDFGKWLTDYCTGGSDIFTRLKWTRPINFM